MISVYGAWRYGSGWWYQREKGWKWKLDGSRSESGKGRLPSIICPYSYWTSINSSIQVPTILELEFQYNVASLEQGYVSAISLSVLYYRLSMDMPHCTAETGSMSLKWGNNCNYHTGPSEYKTSLPSVECPVYGKCWAVAVITSLLVAPSWYSLEKAKPMNPQCSSLWLCCKLPCDVTVVGAYIWNHGELFSPQRVSCRAHLCWSADTGSFCLPELWHVGAWLQNPFVGPHPTPVPSQVNFSVFHLAFFFELSQTYHPNLVEFCQGVTSHRKLRFTPTDDYSQVYKLHSFFFFFTHIHTVFYIYKR